MKDFKTLDEQINILKNKGVIFDDEAKAKNTLLIGNYYNIINGYKEPFLLQTSPELYISNVNFNEIYELYQFDRKLKGIILPAILNVENILRSLISYYFSEKYGNMNYLIIDNFDTLDGQGVSSDLVLKRKTYILELISDINKTIANAVNKKDYITHYVSKYSFVPLWVLVNDLTLGQLSKFYSLMKQPEKIKVSQYWGTLSHSELESYIKTLSYFRNLCAHDDRIYDARCNFPIPNTQYHSILGINMANNGNYVSGKRDFLSLIITFKVLLPKEEFNSVCNKIIGRISSLTTKLNSITINKILASMGIITNNLHLIK